MDLPNLDLPPVTIHYQANETNTIESFQADVEVYSGVDRIPGSIRPAQSYRIAQKIIEGKVFCRIDYPEDTERKIAPRTVITNADEIVIYNHTTSMYEMRLPITSLESSLGIDSSLALQTDSLMGRIPDINALVDEFRRLSYDVSFDATANGYSVRLPADDIASTGVLQGISLRLMFDVQSSVLSGVEAVFQNQDGDIVTGTQTPIYEERSGQLIQVGEVYELRKDLSSGEDGYYPMPSFESADMAQEISEAELAALSESGQTIQEFVPETGDPSDADYSLITVTQYDNIHINSVDSDVFRISF